LSNALVAVNVAGLYKEPSTDSECVSQAVLGEVVNVQEERDGFTNMVGVDRYGGWIDSRHLVAEWDTADYLTTTIATLFGEVYTDPDPHAELITKLVVGTRVCIAHRAESGDWVPIRLPSTRIGYVHRACLSITHDSGAKRSNAQVGITAATDLPDLKRQVVSAIGRQAVDVGKRLVGTPYLWGGRTPFGMDCSGFTQLCYRLSGLQILRDAAIQATDRRFGPVDGDPRLAAGKFEAGDLLLFHAAGQNDAITHIGLATGDGRFLHCSRRNGVHMDFCETSPIGDRFAGAVRLLAHADLAIDAA
jgi:cell wall-associated NlpC family hydrolase